MQQSLDSALKTDDLIAQACAYRGLGEIYRKLDSSKSYDYFSHAINLFDKAGDEIGAEEVRALKIIKSLRQNSSQPQKKQRQKPLLFLVLGDYCPRLFYFLGF